MNQEHGLHDGPEGLGMAERMQSLAAALDRGDLAMIDRFSLKEMHDVFLMQGHRDVDLMRIVRIAEEAGHTFLNPDSEGNDPDEEELLVASFEVLFPEWEHRDLDARLDS